MNGGLQIKDRYGEKQRNIPSSNGQLPTPSVSPIPKYEDRNANTPVVKPKDNFSHGTGNVEPSQKKALSDGGYDLPTVDTVLKTTSHDVDDDGLRVPRKRSISKIGSPVQASSDGEKILKLSPARMQELMSSPQSLPLRNAPVIEEETYDLDSPSEIGQETSNLKTRIVSTPMSHTPAQGVQPSPVDVPRPANVREAPNLASIKMTPGASPSSRPGMNLRATSTPHLRRRQSSSKPISTAGDHSKTERTTPAFLKLENDGNRNINRSGSLKNSPMPDFDTSPMPASLPLPPLSIPAYLQLELSSDRPSPLYIYRPSTSDTPYESTRIKFERLVNFLRLPPELERVFVFGTLSCLDAFLYTFTILPLRFLKAGGIFFRWILQNLLREIIEIGGYIRHGLGRAWRQRRRNTTNSETTAQNPPEKDEGYISPPDPNMSKQRTASSRENTHVAAEIRQFVRGHRRIRSTPSALLPEHKADILKGLLVIMSCILLNYFDASRMYHSIRGQAAIKLYVIYNVLEVCSPCTTSALY